MRSWCKYCNPGKGCQIYAKRPESCRTFRCGWLDGLGDETLRPDRCGAMFSAYNHKGERQIHVHVNTGRSWQDSEEVKKVVDMIVATGTKVIVIEGTKRRQMN